MKIADEYCFIDGSPMSDKQNEMGSKVQALLHISEWLAASLSVFPYITFFWISRNHVLDILMLPRAETFEVGLFVFESMNICKDLEPSLALLNQ